MADDEDDACAIAADLLSFLPDHNDAAPPFEETADPSDRLTEDLESIVPDNPNKPYDMVKVIETVVDDGRFVQLFDAYAENIIIGFARLGGRSVGVIANQPQVLAGCLDIDASIKAARFIRTCDAFNLPLLTVEDVPGFLPGVVQEWGGIIRHGAKLLYAYAEATVPKMTSGHPEGLRRRLPRHVLQALGERLQRGVAHGRTGRHGSRGCGEHHPST